MIEQQICIPTGDGEMPTFVCYPERGAPYAAVFLLMDAPGVREELRDMVRRLASAGYCVLLPNLYYRAGNNPVFDPASVLTAGSEEHKRMRAIRTRMTIPPVMQDFAALIRFADSLDCTVAGASIGTHGYCMSGPYALAAAAAFPERVAAAASIYGTWLVSDAEQSPHATLAQVRGEIYIACAEHDDLAPPEMVARLKALFEAAAPLGELEVHPAVHHGFAFPERWCYDKDAAERHWERLHALYRRMLTV